jgi:hypothetical protein
MWVSRESCRAHLAPLADVATKTKAAKVLPITAMPVLARLLHSSVSMGSRGSIRYAAVGLGHIAQVAVLPAFEG